MPSGTIDVLTALTIYFTGDFLPLEGKSNNFVLSYNCLGMMYSIFSPRFGEVWPSPRPHIVPRSLPALGQPKAEYSQSFKNIVLLQYGEAICIVKYIRSGVCRVI